MVFVAAGLIGAGAGVLTFFSTGNTAGAVFAGVTAFGVSSCALHKLIG
ncbi:hypothetical protein ACFXCZ_31940 [Streptomyces sp. NPDC059396]